MIDRRRFLQASLAAALPVCADSPRASFPSAARDRIAIASWPFRKLFDPKKGTLPLLEFPKMVVDRFGVHAIEPLDQHFAETTPAYVDQFRIALDKAGVRVANIPVGRLGASFYDPARHGIAIETAKKWVDVASTLGSPSIRAHIASANVPPNPAIAADSLKQVAEYGEKKNVVVHLENDDARSEEAFFLIDVIRSANTPWLRALPDFCNSMLLNRGEDYNTKAVAALFQHAWGICHVKDSEQDGQKMHQVNLTRLLAISKQAGFRGYYSIEYDAEGDPFQPTGSLIQQVLAALV
ncbi:MAG TPA: TIM barrel protein [Bryobacteraceae bacterium]|nr:TIM barrel protein [Bryobacteraceae bacterium]